MIHLLLLFLLHHLTTPIISSPIHNVYQHLTTSVRNGKVLEVRKILKSSKKFPSSYYEPLLWASVFRGNRNILSMLLKKAPRQLILTSRHPSSGATLLHAACFEGNARIVKLLLDVRGGGSAWMNVRDQMSGDTPMEALIQGWDHQFRNFHNTPILQMLAGK